MARAGLSGHEAKVWFANFAAHVVVGVVAFVWLSRRPAAATDNACIGRLPTSTPPPLTGRQRVTLAIIGGLDRGRPGVQPQPRAVGICRRRDPPGRQSGRRRRGGAARAMGHHHDGVRRVRPDRGAREDRRDGLVHGAARQGGVAGLGQRRHRIRDRRDLHLQQHVGRRAAGVSADGAETGRQRRRRRPLAIALSINVGSSLVDVSPLSTLGALCVAAVPDPAASRRLFQSLLAWGLSMTLVGACCASSLPAGWPASDQTHVVSSSPATRWHRQEGLVMRTAAATRATPSPWMPAACALLCVLIGADLAPARVRPRPAVPTSTRWRRVR